MITKKIKLTTYILLVAVILILSACADDNDENNDKPIILPEEQLFHMSPNYRWIMKSQLGDSAYFEAKDTTMISVTNVFWDTATINRFELKAIPIEFVYWNNNLKKKQYFALGLTDSGYIFASKNISILSEYSLDFYVKLFFIPKQVGLNDFNYDSAKALPIGQSMYNVRHYVEWKNKGNIDYNEKSYNHWAIEYFMENEKTTPQLVSNSANILVNLGFYKYLNYELIEIVK